MSSTAVLEFRGRKHVVRLVNVSPSGAMVIFPHIPNIGERLPLQILDRGVVIGTGALGQGRPHRPVLRGPRGVARRWR